METDERSDSTPVLKSAAAANLSEDEMLGLMRNSELPSEVLERISKNSAAMKSGKVRLAVAQHPRTPRHVALPLLRHLFTFELMQVALNSAVAADLKKSAEEVLIGRLESVSVGEKLALARRATGSVAAELLIDSDPRVMQAALENARLMEGAVVKAVLHPASSAALVSAVCQHAKWAVRREVRIALLRNENTPRERALEYARGLPETLVREVLEVSSLPESVKAALVAETRE